MKKQSNILIAIIAMFVINSCARNPVTGKKQVVFMSEAQEIAMGKEADPQVIAQFGLYEDSTLQRFINEKGKQMAAISHRPKLQYNFRVINSEVLNAFAVPGGYVYFTRGIMAHFNDEASFAGVLGHEIGHITARHSVAQQRNSILGQIGIIAGVVLAPDLAQFAESASQGLGLLFLKFGRDDERQADELGVEYSSKINYDAHEMAIFFNTLERQSKAVGAAEIPEFLSTHPNPGDRNVTVTKLADEWKQKLKLTNPQINRNQYLRRIEGLVYGEDPREGYRENNVFYHPVLKFKFATPAGWNYQNTPQRVQLAPVDGKALMFLTAAPAKTLQEAASALVQQNNLAVIESREETVNGLKAIKILADVKPAQAQQGQQQQQVSIRTLSYLIQQGDLIYLMLGVSAINDFSGYINNFSSSMESFSVLTDPSKINKKPERIHIKSVRKAGTLWNAFLDYKVAEKNMEAYSILNGMLLTDKVSSGMLIKIVE
ncbi:MAG: M48 family metalloprotease [Ferruginibacter sp.]